MIVTATALTASPIDEEDLTFPALFWQTVADVVTATSEEEGYPASNLSNPSTNLLWRAITEADQYLTVTLGDDIVDYVAIARHNFGSSQFLVSVEVTGTDSPNDWDEVISPMTVEDDAPLIFRFLPQNADSPALVTGVRVRIQQSGDSPAIMPEAAVLYVGKSLVFERGMQGTYTPLPFGRSTNVVSGRSESGDFLGRIVTGKKTDSGATFRGLTPAWVREFLDPFLEVSDSQPFFFAWSPFYFPLETGFAWLDSDPQPGFDLDGYVEIEFQMTGIVE